MNRRIVLVIYNLLLPVALLLSLPGHLLKMLRRGGYGRGFGERFARYSEVKREQFKELENPVWIHAVSVGEVNIAKKLLHALRERDAQMPVVISTTTPTGYAIAEASEASVVVYHPVDFRLIARRALRAIAPRALVLVEAEVWPNLVSIARHDGLEVTLVNARLSPRSERRYRKFKVFTAPVFEMLSRVCVQEAEDVARWESLGVRRERIEHLGSIKFDPAGAKVGAPKSFAGLLEQHLCGRDARILLAGSTHPGEEALVGKVYLDLRERFPDLYYLVAPRHVERCGEVLADLKAIGLRPALRSQIGTGSCDSGESDCLVIDTTGELGAWYCEAELVVIGKSFLAQGGQNPVEPIFAGKPVFYGPHMENFTALVRMLERAGGAVQVDNAEALAQALAEGLEEPETMAETVAKATAAMAIHDGASARTASLILDGKGD